MSVQHSTVHHKNATLWTSAACNDEQGGSKPIRLKAVGHLIRTFETDKNLMRVWILVHSVSTRVAAALVPVGIMEIMREVFRDRGMKAGGGYLGSSPIHQQGMPHHNRIVLEF